MRTISVEVGKAMRATSHYLNRKKFHNQANYRSEFDSLNLGAKLLPASTVCDDSSGFGSRLILSPSRHAVKTQISQELVSRCFGKILWDFMRKKFSGVACPAVPSYRIFYKPSDNQRLMKHFIESVSDRFTMSKKIHPQQTEVGLFPSLHT
jgi:hypothetical protein